MLGSCRRGLGGGIVIDWCCSVGKGLREGGEGAYGRLALWLNCSHMLCHTTRACHVWYNPQEILSRLPRLSSYSLVSASILVY